MTDIDVLVAIAEGNKEVLTNFLQNHCRKTFTDDNSPEKLNREILSSIDYKFRENIKDSEMVNLINLAVEKGCTQLLDFLLIKAVRANQIDIVKLLLKNGANVNTNILDLDTPLSEAVSYENIEVVRILIENKADVNIKDNDQGRTPLHHAAYYRYPEIMKLLIAKGANVNSSSKFGDTPLHNCLSSDFDIDISSLQVIKILLEHGADINAKDDGGNTLLHEAIKLSHEAHEEDQEDEDVSLPDEVNIEEEKDERIKLVELLIKCGADVDVTNKQNETPLYYAINREEDRDFGLKITKLLLKNGANTEIIIGNEHSNMDFGHILSGTSLYTAVATSNLEAAELLIKHGANVNARNDQGEAILHRAVRCKPDMTKLLLEHCANTEVRDSNGSTPLNIAAREGSVENIEILVKYGANIEARDNHGLTPLHLACLPGRGVVYKNPYVKKQTIKYLLDQGADFHSLDNQGRHVMEKIPDNANYHRFDKVKIETISLVCHYTGCLDLSKQVMYVYLKNNIDRIIEHELKKPDNTLDGLKNIIEAFSHADEHDFCNDINEKVEVEIAKVSAKALESYNFLIGSGVSIQMNDLLLVKAEFEKPKKLLDKWCSSTEGLQENGYVDSLNNIVDRAYEQVTNSYNRVDNYIVSLTKRVIEPTKPLGSIAHTKGLKVMLDFSDPGDVNSLFLTRDHKKTETALEKIANDMIASAAKIQRMEGDIEESITFASDIKVMSLGLGGVEETKGQD